MQLSTLTWFYNHPTPSCTNSPQISPRIHYRFDIHAIDINTRFINTKTKFWWMAVSFIVGQSFSSYSALEKLVKDYDSSNFVKLSKSDCKKTSASSTQCPDKSFNNEIIYSQLKYDCSHGGKVYKSRSRGDRPNQTTGKIGYPYVLRLKSTKDGQFLEVAQFVELHNHETTEIEFQLQFAR